MTFSGFQIRMVRQFLFQGLALNLMSFEECTQRERERERQQKKDGERKTER